MLKQVILRAFVLVAIAAPATVAAKADPLDFTLTGKDTDITFTLNSKPTVSVYSTTYGYFEIDNVTLDVNGTDEVSPLAFFTGGASGPGGGLASDLFDLFGPQLFTGSVKHPTFKTGDFTLTSSSDSYTYCDSGDYKLSITDPTSVTPEPPSVLLLATGVFALMGAGVVKRYAA